MNRRGWAAVLACLVVGGCSSPETVDAGAMDTGAADVGARDTGSDDAGDASRDSAQEPDATTHDAGVDARDLGDAGLDAFAPDASCSAPVAGALGGPCTTDAICDSAVGAGDGFCLRGMVGSTTWPTEGFCTNRIDACTLDGDCGAGNHCATVEDPLGPFRVCLPGCAASDCACPAGQVCRGTLARAPLRDGVTACGPGTSSARDGAACASLGECAADSDCFADAFELPNGQCRRMGCTLGDDATCAPAGDGHCVSASTLDPLATSGTVCVDACASDADCRIADGYRCVDGGAGVGRYCRHPQAGDACAVDADCGSPSTWDCALGPTFPGGACTPTTGCPTPGAATGCSRGSSVCAEGPAAGASDNLCVDRCPGPEGSRSTCRTGYTCRDTDPAAGTGHVALGCVGG
ncbi:MAG: hypothetical protein U0234_16760 [Sandaracinus sp.]